jgi:hypothetical protein
MPMILQKDEARGFDGESLELDFLSASIFGLEANFYAARDNDI